MIKVGSTLKMKAPDIWIRNITAIAEKEKQDNIRPVCRSIFHWAETGTHLLVSFHGFSNGPFQMDNVFEQLDPKFSKHSKKNFPR